MVRLDTGSFHWSGSMLPDSLLFKPVLTAGVDIGRSKDSYTLPQSREGFTDKIIWNNIGYGEVPHILLRSYPKEHRKFDLL